MKTPPIATHQVAFVVSDFHGSAKHCVYKNTTIYSFTRDEYADQIQYVLNEAPLLLAAMERVTETPYELPKLDLFAVPDFKTDAMGNWGLTTYRYVCMYKCTCKPERTEIVSNDGHAIIRNVWRKKF